MINVAMLYFVAAHYCEERERAGKALADAAFLLSDDVEYQRIGAAICGRAPAIAAADAASFAAERVGFWRTSTSATYSIRSGETCIPSIAKHPAAELRVRILLDWSPSNVCSFHDLRANYHHSDATFLQEQSPCKYAAALHDCFVILLIALIGRPPICRHPAAADRQHAREQALERYDYRQAADHLEKSLWWRAGDPDVQMLAAQTARRRGNFEAADRHLQLAGKAGAPAQALATERNLRAIQLGDMTAAPGLAQICDENPAGPEATLGFEVIFEGGMKSFQLAFARHAIDSWLKHRPGKFDQAHALVWRGRLHQYYDEWAQAIADYHRALELDPDHTQAHVALAMRHPR